MNHKAANTITSAIALNRSYAIIISNVCLSTLDHTWGQFTATERPTQNVPTLATTPSVMGKESQLSGSLIALAAQLKGDRMDISRSRGDAPKPLPAG